MPLTDAACKAAKCPDTEKRKRFADSGGLYLEVTPLGSKLWRWKYRYSGKEKRLAIGVYPEVSLAQARRDRDAARAKLDAGEDPVQVKKDAVQARRLAIGTSFESIARDWYKTWSNEKSERHTGYVLRRLEADVFPAIGQKPISSVTALHLLALAKKIEERGALDISKRALQTCSQVFRYAIVHGAVDRNPAADVRPKDALKPRKPKHYARISGSELPDLLRKMEVYQGTPSTRIALKLMALTFVRTTELIEARWEEFDLAGAEWRIPAERMKLPTPHIVPLATQAVDALQCLAEVRKPVGLLFPGERIHEKPMSNNTILKALAIMGYKGKMTGHGFRGVASTVLHEHDFDHAHIELQLAHMERDEVSAAYNFATYLKQRRAMMQWWADHLDKLRVGAKILPFSAAAA